MTPAEVPEWLKAYGPLGVALWMVIAAVKNKAPDNPPKSQDEKLDLILTRLALLEIDVAVLKDRAER